MDRLLTANATLCDFGGSVGVCYYAYRERARFPPGLSWVVCELPEAVELGKQLAEQQHASGLCFTPDRAVMDGCDILLAAGVVQFLERTLAEMIGTLPHPPRHILVNRLPLIERGPGFFTLQNTGYSVTPVRVDTIALFITSMEAAGYIVRDTWKCFENSMQIPGHPECTLGHFYGFCFSRREDMNLTR